jgi:arsenate reductase-like glutaredoxin family protein
MTYREAIQEQIAQLEKLYDDASPLRDAAVSFEKQTFNDVRGLLRTASSLYRKLDDRLPDNRAQMEL